MTEKFLTLAEAAQDANRLRAGGPSGPDIDCRVADHQARAWCDAKFLGGQENRIRKWLGARGAQGGDHNLEMRLKAGILKKGTRRSLITRTDNCHGEALAKLIQHLCNTGDSVKVASAMPRIAIQPIDHTNQFIIQGESICQAQEEGTWVLQPHDEPARGSIWLVEEGELAKPG